MNSKAIVSSIIAMSLTMGGFSFAEEPILPDGQQNRPGNQARQPNRPGTKHGNRIVPATKHGNRIVPATKHGNRIVLKIRLARTSMRNGTNVARAQTISSTGVSACRSNTATEIMWSMTGAPIT